jgi:hypothetical protein
LWLRNYSSNPDLFLGGRELLHLWTHRDLNSNPESQLGSERKKIDKPRMMLNKADKKGQDDLVADICTLTEQLQQ